MRNTDRDDKLIRYLANKAAIVHEPLVEDHPPEEDFDEDQLQTVRELMAASPWGWCVVKTSVLLGDYRAVVYLGGCSYASAEEFVRCDSGTQVFEACAQLLADMRDRVERGKQAAEALTNIRVNANAAHRAAGLRRKAFASAAARIDTDL